MKFQKGDYVVLKDGSTFLWRVLKVESKDQIHADAPPTAIMPISNRLRMEPICHLDGKPLRDVVLQEGWDVDFEPPNPLLLLALVSRHETPFSR